MYFHLEKGEYSERHVRSTTEYMSNDAYEQFAQGLRGRISDNVSATRVPFRRICRGEPRAQNCKGHSFDVYVIAHQSSSGRRKTIDSSGCN